MPGPAAGCQARPSSTIAAPASVQRFPEGQSLAIPPQYRRIGKVTAPYTVTPQQLFAVVEVGGTQYKVTPDDLIYSEKLGGVDVNDRVALDRVLMLGSTEQTVVGRPYVLGSSVTAVVEEQFLDGKVLIFKKRRRKNSRRMQGHRQPLTTLRVVAINGLSAPESASEGDSQVVGQRKGKAGGQKSELEEEAVATV